MFSLTRRLRAEDGATTVEFLAVLPIVIALAFGAWQALVAGQVAWLSGGAAASAARAQAVGKDPREAARASLPASLHRGLRVRVRDDEVVVRIAIPVVVGERRLGVVSARAHLRDQQS